MNMKNTLNTTFLFSETQLRISENVLDNSSKIKQHLIVASVINNNRVFVKRKDFRVHPDVNDAANWDENWFCSYE